MWHRSWTAYSDFVKKIRAAIFISIFRTSKIAAFNNQQVMLARATILFILLTPILSRLSAQQDSLHPVCKLLNLSNNWGFGAGIRSSFLDFEEMNDALESAGLPGLESPVTSVDVNVRTSFSWKHFVIESGLKYAFGASQRSNLENRHSVTFRDYAWQSRLMLDVFHTKRLSKIFPFAGIGVSYQVLKTNSAGVSGEGIPNPTSDKQSRRFTYIPFSFEAGLSVEQGVKMFGKNIFFGFRSGYAFRFFQTKWSLDDNYAVDLPKPAGSAPFVALSLRIHSAPKMTCPLTKGQ